MLMFPKVISLFFFNLVWLNNLILPVSTQHFFIDIFKSSVAKCDLALLLTTCKSKPHHTHIDFNTPQAKQYH